MGILDRIGSLADKLHIGSEGDYQQAGQPVYDDQDGAYEPYGYDQGGYEEPAREQQTQYEPNYNMGGRNVTGVRPARTTQKNRSARGGIGGLIDRIRGPVEPQYDPQPSYGDNVIPISDYDNGNYEPQPRRQGASSAPRSYGAQPQPAPPRQTATRQGSTMIYLVRRLDDSEEIIEHMMNGGNVIVNMEEIDEALKRRVLDFISGAAYALECTVKRISYRNYFIAPSGEEVLTNVSSREPVEDSGYRPRDRQYDW